MPRYQVQQGLMFSRDCLRLSSLSVIVLSHVVTYNGVLFFSLHACLSFYVIPLFFTNSSFVNYSFYVAPQFFVFSPIFLVALVVICYRSVIVVDYIPVFQKDAWRSGLLTVTFQIDVRRGSNKDGHYKNIRVASKFRRYFLCDDMWSIITNFTDVLLLSLSFHRKQRYTLIESMLFRDCDTQFYGETVGYIYVYMCIYIYVQ